MNDKDEQYIIDFAANLVPISFILISNQVEIISSINLASI